MIDHPVLAPLAEHGGMKLGLEAIREFLRFVGDPHLAVPTVHVAGTNGKGSVATMLTEALVAAGLRVGTTTSPHLVHVNERIRLDGVPLSDEALDAALGRLDRDRRAWAAEAGLPGPPLTYFELVTAAAFQVFADARVDVAVVEVGLGGRLDATNVVVPEACAVTSIGLDHTVELGPTLASIAGEKAGIFEAGVPVVLGPVPDEALAVLRARAAALEAPVWDAVTDLRAVRTGERWTLSAPDGVVDGVRLALPGVHQGWNAAVVLGLVQRLRQRGFAVPDDAVRAGLARARIGARVEVVRPGLVVDGCHNPDGAAALAAWLSEQPRPARRVLLFGCGVDRDPAELVAPLLPHVDEVVAVTCAHPKARSAEDVAAALGGPARAGGPVEACLDRHGEAEVVVAGSLYLAGAALRALGGSVSPPSAPPRAPSPPG